MMCSQRAAEQPAFPSLKRRILPDASCLGEGIALFPVSGAFFFFFSFKTPRLCVDYSPALGHIAHAVLPEESSGKRCSGALSPSSEELRDD